MNPIGPYWKPERCRFEACAGGSLLLSSFSAVTLPTQHLAVLYDRSPTVTPGGNMVALHELKVVFLATKWTDVVLLFPYGKFNVLGETAQVEVVFVAS